MKSFITHDPVHTHGDSNTLDPIGLGRLGRLIGISIAAQILLLFLLGPWLVLAIAALSVGCLIMLLAFRSIEHPESHEAAPQMVDNHCEHRPAPEYIN